VLSRCDRGTPDLGLRRGVEQTWLGTSRRWPRSCAPGSAGNRVARPQLTARTLSAVADEAARLLLTDPEAYPIERLLAHADWLLSRLEPTSG
jgi:hypothetical protein